jgi:hypothetical protein
MPRLLSLALLSLLLAGRALAADNLAGTWRQETEEVGVSYWELTPKGDGTYGAQEYGLGGATGTAVLKGEHMIIHFETAGGDKGHYEWRLKGTAGRGKLVVRAPGEDEKMHEKSSVRFIGK